MNTEHLLTKQNGIQAPFRRGNFGLAGAAGILALADVDGAVFVAAFIALAGVAAALTVARLQSRGFGPLR